MDKVEQEHNRKQNDDNIGITILVCLVIGFSLGYSAVYFPITVGSFIGVSFFGLLIWKRKG